MTLNAGLAAALSAMDEIASRATNAVQGESTIASRAALAAAYMQGAAMLRAAQLEAAAIRSLAERLAPATSSTVGE